jgi:hypothetical protein
LYTLNHSDDLDPVAWAGGEPRIKVKSSRLVDVADAANNTSAEETGGRHRSAQEKRPKSTEVGHRCAEKGCVCLAQSETRRPNPWLPLSGRSRLLGHRSTRMGTDLLELCAMDFWCLRIVRLARKCVSILLANGSDTLHAR